MNKIAKDGRPAYPLKSNFSPDLFVGTAQYYAQYRVPYPQELIDDLKARANITGEGWLLDLACGTGEVALSMYSYFSEVWAVDQEQEMVNLGRTKAKQCGATNVHWKVVQAEDLVAPHNRFKLITIGAAYHRLDRPLIAERAMEWLKDNCSLAVMASNSVWKGKEEWQSIAVNIIDKWISSKSNAKPNTTKKPYRSHMEVLKFSGFEDVEEYQFLTPYVWTLDSFVGYLYSTSKVSKRILGEKAEDFEKDLKSALLAYDSRGEYPETMEFYYIFARRPSFKS